MGEEKFAMKVAIIQLNSSNNKKNNLEEVRRLVTECCEKHQPTFVALPEMFSFLGGNIEDKKNAAEDITKSESIETLKKLARNFKVYIHGGSIIEYDAGNYFNTTCVINPTGEIIAKYRKINLFNFSSLKKESYNEAALFSPGDAIITYDIGNIKIGATICFDLRFCKIFEQLIKKNVDVIVVPSAFTYETGKAHWEILCRARAIETQCYLLAPAQTGTYRDNVETRSTWGHSMIVNPWGDIIAKLESEVGFTVATLDFDFLKKVRERLPCHPASK